MGVILFLLLCGRYPFDGETDAEILRKINIGAFQFVPEDVWTSISEDAKDLILNMLFYDPK